MALESQQLEKKELVVTLGTVIINSLLIHAESSEDKWPRECHLETFKLIPDPPAFSSSEGTKLNQGFPALDASIRKSNINSTRIFMNHRHQSKDDKAEAS